MRFNTIGQLEEYAQKHEWEEVDNYQSKKNKYDARIYMTPYGNFVEARWREDGKFLSASPISWNISKQ